MIPKKIHYCWFGNNALPSNVKKCIKSWRKMCPDYEIICWNENNFDVNTHSFTRKAYEEKAWAFVSDYVRLKVIYDNGGIYLDTDVELLKNLDSLLKYQCYIGVQQCEHLCSTGLGFGAEKGNPVIKKMIESYDTIDFKNEDRKMLACPYLNNAVMKDLGYIYENKPILIGQTLILPPQYLDPIAPGKEMKNLKSKDTIYIHHYSASWMGKRVKVKRRIIDLIGQEKVNFLKKNIIKTR